MPKKDGNLLDAFEDLIKDLYSAEKQILKSLPKMAKTSHNEQLKRGMENHVKDTENQIDRLEKIANEVGFRPSGKTCHGVKGLIEETNEHIKDHKPGPLMDAILIADAQKVEHYEISGYGTARQWAKLMGQDRIVQLLEQSIQEEEKMDREGTKIAESQVNQQALHLHPVEELPRQRVVRTRRKEMAV